MIHQFGCESFASWTFSTPKRISEIYHPQIGLLQPPTKKIARRTILAYFAWFFDLRHMEEIKGGREEMIDTMVMEHIK